MKKILRLINKVATSKVFFGLCVIAIFAAGFGVRLYKINNPIADWHSWRQADTASVSRIYLEQGIDLLYPKYHDISSIQTGMANKYGFRMVEFPLYNAIHAIAGKVITQISFETLGRLIAVLFSMISALCLVLIGTKIYNKYVGFLSAFFFLFIPYSVFYSRVILPEPVSISLGLMGITFFVYYIYSLRRFNLIFFTFFFALSLLVKPFSIFYLLPLGILAIQKFGIKTIFRNFDVLLAFSFALIPFFLWRMWINQFPVGIAHFAWAFNGDNIRFRPAFWRWIFGERIGNLILGMWGLIPFSFGILTSTKKNFFALLLFVGTLIYVTVIATANVRHDYYQAFLMPPIAMLVGYGSYYLWTQKEFNRVVARLVLLFSIAMMLMSGVFQIREYYKVNHPEIIEAGQKADELLPKDALVIAPYNGDTAFLYQTKRWGWPIVEDSFDNLIAKGADYFISVNYDADTNLLLTKYQTLEKNPRFVIIDLHKPIALTKTQK